MFDGFTTRVQDNSTKVTNTSDSFNTTSSWSQGISDTGNTSISFNKSTPMDWILPVAVVGLILVVLSKAGGGR